MTLTIVLIVLLVIALGTCAYLLYRSGESSVEKEISKQYADSIDRIIRRAEEIRSQNAKHKEALGGVDWDDVDRIRGLSGAKTLDQVSAALLHKTD